MYVRSKLEVTRCLHHSAQTVTSVCTVSLFVYWLYTHKLPDVKENGYDWQKIFPLDMTFEAETELHKACLQLCVTAYAFGDRFLVPHFRRIANNTFLELTKCPLSDEPVDHQLISYAFENIPAERILLQYMTDDYCGCWQDEDTNHYSGEAIKDLPAQFLRRLPSSFIELGRIISG